MAKIATADVGGVYKKKEAATGLGNAGGLYANAVNNSNVVSYINELGEKAKGYAGNIPGGNVSNGSIPNGIVPGVSGVTGTAAGGTETVQPGTGEMAQPPAVNEPAETDYWAMMREMYRKQYDDSVAANDAASALAAQRASEAAQEQIDAMAAQYAGTNRQLYRDYMETKKALPQQMAAQGYSGGLSESARLRLGTSYEEALAENERARLAAAAGINSEKAQNIFDIEQATSEANRQAAALRNQNLMALEQEKFQYDEAIRQAAAEQMAAAGDFSGLVGMGYSQEDVDYLTRIWLLENPGAASAWMQAHPEDAKRLGLTSGGGQTVYGSLPKEEEATEADKQRNALERMLRMTGSAAGTQNNILSTAARNAIVAALTR